MRIKSRLSTGLVIASVFLLATTIVPASADEHRDEHRGRARGHHGDWGGGGYYPAPPIVYGQPQYYQPPVVYGPAVGIALPGISIGIR